jgi:hypothetical protein
MCLVERRELPAFGDLASFTSMRPRQRVIWELFGESTLATVRLRRTDADRKMLLDLCDMRTQVYYGPETPMAIILC